MSLRAIHLIFVLCISALIALPVVAKVGIQATVHTPVPVDATEGSELQVSWTLAHKDSGMPFNPSTVFIRLIGPLDESTESFARYGAHADGHYEATVKIPKGGVDAIEIGVAGTMIDREGHSERSDWLIPQSGASP